MKFIVKLEPKKGMDEDKAMISLRLALKVLLRSFGFTCTSIETEKEDKV